MAALSVMTCISVGIGYVFKNVPEALKTSAPIGEYLSVALLFYFGLSTLWNTLKTPKEERTCRIEAISNSLYAYSVPDGSFSSVHISRVQTLPPTPPPLLILQRVRSLPLKKS